jgi:hypothetical protein
VLAVGVGVAVAVLLVSSETVAALWVETLCAVAIDGLIEVHCAEQPLSRTGTARAVAASVSLAGTWRPTLGVRGLSDGWTSRRARERELRNGLNIETPLRDDG